MFLEIYFNEVTTTIAFALIKDKKRIWGIDKDRIRGWHEHPIKTPGSHVKIQPLNIRIIVEKLAMVIKTISPKKP